MKIALLVTSLLLVACENPSGETRIRIKTIYECDEQQKKESADFILKCIANGNPKSDEEPEDWIGMCEDMAHRNICTQNIYDITEQCQSSDYSCDWYDWQEIKRELRK